ncbi:hypothetical protein C5B85_18060 [Pseudoclavibacter sp. AY1F1]|uniref:glycosyl hydrolase n=1 Tax=Pseudoclavibacter sp. AY1F1 TaxID=2080583 RepID=UPI000CE71D82|nr:glycosyl hydrolase [Pseudoclavibacter sp. AY1F1]PPF41912.1 hypothetical protein C5B85_18060 [Pseudoclavibacter sp. AY1F1]
MTQPRRGRRRRTVAIATAASLSVLLSPLLATPATADPTSPTAAVPVIDTATFADPPASVRPMFRWWMPLAYTEDSVLREQLDQIAASGAGGVEVAPFIVAGEGNQSNAFLAEYGWGTPAWAHKMEVITEKAAELGLIVDQNLGPHYPPTVPTLNSFNQPEAEQQLIFGWSAHAPGETIVGALPAPLTAPPSVSTKLAEAATAGQTSLTVASLGGFAIGDVVTLGTDGSAEKVTVTAVGDRLGATGTLTVTPLSGDHAVDAPLVNVAETTRLRTVIAQCEADCAPGSEGPAALVPGSILDVTDKVVDGQLDYTFPTDGTRWAVIDFQQTASGLVGQRGGYTATQPNYVVDHLGKGGVDIQADFWDENILTDAVKANLDKVGGGAIFEDSLELGESQKWTWSFLDQFEERRGYDATDVLPALAGIGIQGSHEAAFEIGEIGDRAREDYRETVSDLFIDEYVAPMQSWAQTHGLDFRVQAYGLPTSTSHASSAAGIPEGESLNFGSPNPLGAEQNYRAVSGGAHLSGKDIVSVECCAVFFGGYRSGMAGPNIGGQFSDSGEGSVLGGKYSQGLLDSVYKSYAGGVNQLVWHGFAYPDAPTGVGIAGRDGGTWPGYQPWDIFGALNVNDVFGPRQANWEDMTGVNDALARTQYVLREGQAKLDLGVYYEDLGLKGSSVSGQQAEQHMLGTDSATSSAGYTYDYFAPQFLAEEGLAPDADGGLFGDRSGYKAVVLNDQRTISLDGARSLRDLAKKGLRVYVVGQAPSELTGAEPGAEELKTVVAELLAQPSVTQLGSEAELPSALGGDSITPAAAPSDQGSALGFVRRAADGVTYDFVYNRSGEAVQQTLTLAGTGRPYQLDPWSGEVTPVGEFTQDGDSVTVSIDVAAHDTAIFALVDETEPGTHAVASDAQVLAPEADGSVSVRVTGDGTFRTEFSDGTSTTTEVGGLAPAQGLTAWSLAAQTWGPGPDSTGMTASKTLKTDQEAIEITADADGKLPSWLEISGDVDLSSASGLGTYSTTVTLPNTWQEADGAYLGLGDVLDTAQVWVNGQQVTVNQADRSRIDLGHHLEPGDNSVVVRVATTMFNAVKATGDSNYQTAENQRTGLMGPITLTPYRDTVAFAAPQPTASPEPTGEPTPQPTSTDGAGTTAPTSTSTSTPGNGSGNGDSNADGQDGDLATTGIDGSLAGFLALLGVVLAGTGTAFLIKKRRGRATIE